MKLNRPLLCFGKSWWNTEQIAPHQCALTKAQLKAKDPPTLGHIFYLYLFFLTKRGRCFQKHPRPLGAVFRNVSVHTKKKTEIGAKLYFYPNTTVSGTKHGVCDMCIKPPHKVSSKHKKTRMANRKAQWTFMWNSLQLPTLLLLCLMHVLRLGQVLSWATTSVLSQNTCLCLMWAKNYMLEPIFYYFFTFLTNMNKYIFMTPKKPYSRGCGAQTVEMFPLKRKKSGF